jgi:transcriptional regulator with XRE-family HTH domain
MKPLNRRQLRPLVLRPRARLRRLPRGRLPPRTAPMATPQVRFGQLLKRWRTAAGLNQEALATALGLRNRSSVSQWERGVNRPELGLLPQLAVVLGVSFRVILSAWWEIELPPIASAEGVVLAQRTKRLSQRDRQRLTTQIDAWVLPRDAVEAVLAEEMRHLIDVMEAHRAEALEQEGDGS